MTDRDERIRKALHRAHTALDNALADALRAMDRVAEHRRRVARLELALRVPAEQRSRRAQKAAETRRAKATRRGINIKENGLK